MHLCNSVSACIHIQTAKMQFKSINLDPRYFQVIFQCLFLSYGILYLEWDTDWTHYLTCIAGCVVFNYGFESVKQKRLLTILGKSGFKMWGFSVLISALSLCLLLKTN